jgi:hypothetical protein
MSGERAIGHVRFTDGAERQVNEDAGGRQYVLDDQGEPVCGVWLPPADEPVVVTPADPLPLTPGLWRWTASVTCGVSSSGARLGASVPARRPAPGGAKSREPGARPAAFSLTGGARSSTIPRQWPRGGGFEARMTVGHSVGQQPTVRREHR